MKSILTRAGLTLGLAAIFTTTAAFAQQEATPSGTAAPQQDMGRLGKHPHMGRERAGMGFLQKLNLTDAQKQQLRAIHERYGQSFKVQREELHQLLKQKKQGTLSPEQEVRAQTLRNEMRDNNKHLRDELFAVLTPEQRAQLKEMRQEQKARREEWRENHTSKENNQQ